MPRDIPVGNGRLLINFDNQYRIRDIYYPRVGGENHSSGHPYRFGVWIENQFSWVESDEWQRSMLYKEDTLVTEVVLKCDRLGVELHCEDTVDFHETIYLRQIKVINHADHPREVRLFFYHNFHISDFEVGDTAVWYPQLSALIHYKKMRYFLINGQNAEGQGISDYATGIKEMAGQEGTYRDAEDDGVLGKNPIAQGSVDSTAALQATVGPGDESIFHYWICFGTNYHEVEGLNDVVIAKTPTTLIERTTSYWKLWVKRQLKAHNLSDSITELYKRSLLIIRTQMDDGGAIIAANDTDITQFNRDTYSYMWPRDGALVAHALDLAGYPSLSRTFYEFCRPLLTQEGYFLHKYHSDGSAGSSWHPWLSNGHRQLPIQEDETALVIWALWEHFKIYGDVDEIKPLYRELIMRSGVFMADSLHPTSNLPISSYDLWEERHGIHAFTVGAVYAGIIGASNFAEAFGEDASAEQLRYAAKRLKSGVEANMWRPEANRFVRMVNYDNDGIMQIDWNIDSAMSGLFLFGMFAPDDERIIATMKSIEDRLWIKTDVGGLARYENDYYHQVSQDVQNVAGNPWYICSLWIAQYRIASAKTVSELELALPMLEWVAAHSLPSGVLAEQVNPYTHEPLSVSPLTWSHAAFVTAVVEYCNKRDVLQACPECGRTGRLTGRTATTKDK